MSKQKRTAYILGLLLLGILLFLYLFTMGYAIRKPVEFCAGFGRGLKQYADWMLGWKKLTLFSIAVAGGYTLGELFCMSGSRVLLRRIWRILLLSGVVAIAFLGYRKVYREMKITRSVNTLRSELKSNTRIVHGGGELTGENGEVYRVTNSVEAMEHALAAGERYIELDVRMTKDGDLGCYHSGKYLYDAQGSRYDRNVTTEEFLSAYTEGGYTPMTFSQVVSYMHSYPDLYIVLDIKNKWKRSLAKVTDQAEGLQDRLILQIRHAKHYSYARTKGYNYLIYTLYKASEQELQPERLLTFLGTHVLLGVTFEVEKFDENPELVDLLRSSRESLYTHTVDDEAYISDLLNDGMDAVYTNLVRQKQS